MAGFHSFDIIIHNIPLIGNDHILNKVSILLPERIGNIHPGKLNSV